MASKNKQKSRALGEKKINQVLNLTLYVQYYSELWGYKPSQYHTLPLSISESIGEDRYLNRYYKVSVRWKHKHGYIKEGTSNFVLEHWQRL